MIARNALVASAVGASVLLGGMTLATPAQADSPTTRCHTYGVADGVLIDLDCGLLLFSRTGW
ncbi:hypothetical protein [Streptomyces nigrescens]|uniref:hypothetical protein n=1 Tax=Streptomyces nigrescens TaxID=1920 RepID=UPI0021C25916|nr:hypothetical protein [Streptomyces nigrescens]